MCQTKINSFSFCHNCYVFIIYLILELFLFLSPPSRPHLQEAFQPHADAESGVCPIIIRQGCLSSSLQAHWGVPQRAFSIHPKTVQPHGGSTVSIKYQVFELNLSIRKSNCITSLNSYKASFPKAGISHFLPSSFKNFIPFALKATGRTSI